MIEPAITIMGPALFMIESAPSIIDSAFSIIEVPTRTMSSGILEIASAL